MPCHKGSLLCTLTSPVYSSSTTSRRNDTADSTSSYSHLLDDSVSRIVTTAVALAGNWSSVGTAQSLQVTSDRSQPHMPRPEEEVDLKHLPSVPSFAAQMSILTLALLVMLCSSLVLVATRYTSAGTSATLVFLRCLLTSDLLMSFYGIAKVALIMKLGHTQVNFFLPDSLFFTAALASTLSLLALNLDCFLKLARPLQYAQVDKDTVITVMLLVWNGAFIVGFLPLLGWNQHGSTVLFFSFFPWHYLLFIAIVVLLSAAVCLACMLRLRRLQVEIWLPRDLVQAPFGPRVLEVRKYRHLEHTLLAESVLWLACYLPFFLYIGLTCRHCPLSSYAYSDSSVLYFIPVFLLKSLLSAGMQAVRTFRVHLVMNRYVADRLPYSSCTGWAKSKRRGQRWEEEEEEEDEEEVEMEAAQEGVATIAFTDIPRRKWFSPEAASGRGKALRSRDTLSFLQHCASDQELTDVTHVSGSPTESSSMSGGLTNSGFRSSLDLGTPSALHPPVHAGGHDDSVIGAPPSRSVGESEACHDNPRKPESFKGSSFSGRDIRLPIDLVNDIRLLSEENTSL